MKDVLAKAGLTLDDILGRYTMFNAFSPAGEAATGSRETEAKA